jgi:hypothetical protein
MKFQWIRSAILIGALALAAAACGSSSTSPTDTDASADTPTSDELPAVDSPDVGAPDETPGAAGACLVGEPECYDIGDMQGAPGLPELDEAEPVTADGVSRGMVVGGGLTVSEALATAATGTLAVQGHLYDDGTGATLCETLEGGGERYVCGGAQIAIDNLDQATLGDAVVHHDGLTYTEEVLTLFGELTDSVFTVDNLVAG